MTIKYDNYTPKDPSSTGRIFFRDYEDERADASAGVGVSYPSGIVSVGLTGNEQNVVDGVSSIIPPVTGTGSDSSLKLFTPDDIIAFVAAHETGGGGGGNTWSDPVSSNILPSLANDVAFTLGDPDQRFKEIWVSGIHTFSSIDLRGQVFENVGPTSSTLSGVSIAERNAGEETDFRLFSPADISSMALQHGPAAGSITEGALEDLIAGLDASSIQSNDEFLFRVSSGTDELAVTTASGIVTKGLDDLGIDPQSREVATSDPTVDDDIDLGYSSLDLWLNTNNGKFYINEVATDGAAIWREFAPSGVTAQEITDGSGTDYRLWTPEDVSSAALQHGGGGSDPVVPEMVVYMQTDNIVQCYLNPSVVPGRLGTNANWAGYKADLTEYDDYQIRVTYESGDNTDLEISVVCTSGSTPFNRSNPSFAVSSEGAGEPYEYMNLGQAAAGTAAADLSGVAARDYVESAWTAMDPSVKRECGLAFIYSNLGGAVVGNRGLSNVAVAFRRNR
jgi:hypothetical protein